jgi:hypothetical protein
MSYNTYTKDRVLPHIPIQKSYTSYMKVEPVLRYLQKNALAIQQYKLGNEPNHFFKCADIAGRIGDRLFRVMECEINQWIVEDKEIKSELV